jgi:hypothetical protein
MINHIHGGDLRCTNYKNIPKFSFTGRYEGYIVHVYDGDTLQVAIPFRNGDAEHYERFPVRLLGIDCPEIKYKGLVGSKLPKKCKDKLLIRKLLARKKGYMARDHLIDFLNEYGVWEEFLPTIYGIRCSVRCKTSDLYGRMLSTIDVPDYDGIMVNLSQYMLDSNLAIPCDGKRVNHCELVPQEEIKAYKRDNK